MNLNKALALLKAAVDVTSILMDWVRSVFQLTSAERADYLLAFRGRFVGFLDAEFDEGNLTPPDRRRSPKKMKPERTQ